MSAFYSFAYPDRVHVLTDGGIFDDAGILRGIAEKVIRLPYAPVAITFRGNAETVSAHLQGLQEHVERERPQSADKVLALMQDYFDGVAAGNAFCEAEFLVAACSETVGACHFLVDLHGRTPAQTFKLENLGIQIGGGPSITLDDIGSPSGAEVSDPDFPVRYGVAIMEAMRRKRAAVPGSPSSFFAVGGQCDLTTITPAGATTRRLCTWNDQIGSEVSPSPWLTSMMENAA